jgi:hypothetical protein
MSRPLVPIENSTIDAMRRDSRFATIPCLQSSVVPVASAGCSKCQAAALARVATRSYADIKQCIAGMSAEHKQLLKQVLNAEQISVLFLNASGNKIRIKF